MTIKNFYKNLKECGVNSSLLFVKPIIDELLLLKPDKFQKDKFNFFVETLGLKKVYTVCPKSFIKNRYEDCVFLVFDENQLLNCNVEGRTETVYDNIVIKSVDFDSFKINNKIYVWFAIKIPDMFKEDYQYFINGEYSMIKSFTKTYSNSNLMFLNLNIPIDHYIYRVITKSESLYEFIDRDLLLREGYLEEYHQIITSADEFNPFRIDEMIEINLPKLKELFFNVNYELNLIDKEIQSNIENLTKTE